MLKFEARVALPALSSRAFSDEITPEWSGSATAARAAAAAAAVASCTLGRRSGDRGRWRLLEIDESGNTSLKALELLAAGSENMTSSVC